MVDCHLLVAGDVMAGVKLDPRRVKYLTASEMSAALGRNPYRNGEVVRQEKLGLLEPWHGNQNTEIGSALEPAILGWFEREHGVEIVDRQRFLCDESTPGTVAATIDGREKEGRAFVEAKVQFEPAVDPSLQWGAPYTDEVPTIHAIQAHAQMTAASRANLDVDHVWLVALLLFAREFRVYRIDRDPQIIDFMDQFGIDWFERHITRSEPTPETLPLDVMDRVIRKPLTVRPAEEVAANAIEVVSAWEQARIVRLEAKKREDELQREVLGLLGKYEAVDLGLSGFVQYRAESGGSRFGKGDKYQDHLCPNCKVGKMEITRQVLRWKGQR